jgi:hypothetical protein
MSRKKPRTERGVAWPILVLNSDEEAEVARKQKQAENDDDGDDDDDEYTFVEYDWGRDAAVYKAFAEQHFDVLAEQLRPYAREFSDETRPSSRLARIYAGHCDQYVTLSLSFSF